MFAVPCQLMADNTVLVNFGAKSDSFDEESGWNNAKGEHHPLANIFNRTTTTLYDTTQQKSNLSVAMKVTSGAPLLEGIANTQDLAPTTPSASLKKMWKNAHGVELPDEVYANHWAMGGVAGIATTTSVVVEGLNANSSYTVTGGFTVGGLANVAAKNIPIALGKMEDNQGITLTNAYLINKDGLVVDLLHLGDFSLAEVLKFETFTISWQFETGANASSIQFDFASSLLDLTSADEMRFMAITEHIGAPTPPDITGGVDVLVPEPATTTLSVFALAGFLARRRRK